MIERTAHIQRSEGAMETFIVHPDSGCHPVIVVYHHGPGLDDDTYDIARRIADAGYYTLLPDLYFRFGSPRMTKSSFADEGQRQAMMERVMTLTSNDHLVLEDTDAVLALAAEDDAADATGPKGCIGFCMGARFVIRTLAAKPEEFVAGAGWHPAACVTSGPDSPHLGLAGISGELYFGFGEVDHITPIETMPPLRQELDRHGIKATIDVLSGADHGYAFPHMPAYHRDAAERAWERTLELFGRNLQGAAVA
jgi:carboxymethylenebutenolidase